MQQHDEAQVCDFLRDHFGTLAPGETIEIRAIPLDSNNKKDRKQAFFTTPEAAASWIVAHTSPLVELYYGINPRLGRGGTTANVSRIVCAWADLDFKHFASEDEAMAEVDGFDLAPTTIVKTGGGLHLYWALREPPDATENPGRMRAMLERLYYRLGKLDAVHDLARIFRLPGTWNNKPEYGAPRPVRRVFHDPSALYTIEDFEQRLPTLPNRRSTAPPGGATHDGHWTIDEVRGMLECIDPLNPYDEANGYLGWAKVSAAIADTFPDDEGEALWTEWSQPRVDAGSKGNAEAQPQRWGSFKRGEGQERTTIRTIIYLAKLGGWTPPRGRMGPMGGANNSYSSYSSSLRHDLPPAVPFPVHVLPGALRALVEEGAAAYDMPPEFVGVPALAFAAACIGRSRAIEMKPGMRSFPNLYAAVVGVPGSGKTPGADLARDPLDHLQGEAHARYTAALSAYENEDREWKRTGADQGQPRPTPPRRERFYTTDATTEALGVLLRDSPGIAVERDELISFLTTMDAYRGGRGDDRQRSLMNWSAKSWVVDRKAAEQPHIRYPTPSVIGGIQPALLPRLANEAGQEDGFIDRFLFSYPEADICDWTEESVSDATRRAVRDQYAALRPVACSGEPLVIRPTPEAKARYVAWFRDNVQRQRRESGIVRGIYAKLPQQLSRLALNLHYLRWGREGDAKLVDDETMTNAIELTEYFRAHAHRVIPAFGLRDRKRDHAEKIAAHLLDKSGEWVPRTALHELFSRNIKRTELDQALDALVQQGRVEKRDVGTGTNTREEWRAISDE